MNKARLYFTIGPVQAFVAQSRRTRDLWASSYLLSYLADVAMKAVEDQNSKIILPDRYVATNKATHGQVLHGRWPNRFVAVVDDPQTAADAAKEAFFSAWQEIAERVWDKYIKGVATTGNETEVIWNRQINHFWEISWAAALPEAGQFDPLARRKNWRTPPVAVEPGDHCVMMGSWQELSGFIRSREREKQDAFWRSLRGRLGQLDIGEDERLCAVAMIKRMFPLVAKNVIGTDLQGASWPSTPYIAAIPWLGRAGASNPNLAKEYATTITEKVKRPFGEKNTKIRSLNSIPNVGDFFQLDGNFFHETTLANAKDMSLGLPEDEDAKVRIVLLANLNELYGRVQSRPSSFYAVLLMDGDSMGQLLSEARQESGDAGERSVTQALGNFAEVVPRTVSEHDGVTVYCGGDDVLAMAPVDSALRCALSLTRVYQSCFAEVCPAFSAKPTISAAIVFCPFRTPFREAIGLAHHILDDIAKDATGRDSLAVAVLKSGGVTCQWAAPWEHIVNGETTVLDALVERLRGRDGQIGELSSGLLFQIRERFASLTNDPLTTPGRFGQLPDGIDIERLLLGEYRRGRGHLGNQDAPAESPGRDPAATIQLLLKTCRSVHRTEGVDERSLGIDGPLLVRFLAGETRETVGEEAAQ
jgi:CRISPR-associated protein Cmr2